MRSQNFRFSLGLILCVGTAGLLGTISGCGFTAEEISGLIGESADAIAELNEELFGDFDIGGAPPAGDGIDPAARRCDPVCGPQGFCDSDCDGWFDRAEIRHRFDPCDPNDPAIRPDPRHAARICYDDEQLPGDDADEDEIVDDSDDAEGIDDSDDAADVDPDDGGLDDADEGDIDNADGSSDDGAEKAILNDEAYAAWLLEWQIRALAEAAGE